MTVAPAAPASQRRPRPDRSSVPLLSGKLTPPPLGFAPRPRPRLFDLLSEGLDATPVTLLSGPAGAGKTVLAGSWLQAHRDDWCAAWLSLEEADDEPAAFWAYLLAALRRAGLELPRSTAPGPAEAAPGTLALRLAADLLALPHPVALILDNADSLTRRDLTGALDLLVRYAGARLRLVLCARADPLLPLHRYRLADTLTEIRADRLAFTAEETRALLAGLGTPVSAEVAAALREATEGWAVALRLAAAPLRRGTAPEQLLTELAADDGSVAHYLSAEVLDRQPAAARRVLLRISVADELEPDLVDRLTGQPAARRVLASLARANAFVESAAGAPGGYRIHPLLREILQAQLAYETPGEFAALHRTCATWYARAGRRPQAVRHALAAGDEQLAARLLIDDLAVARVLAHGLSPGQRTPIVPAATAGPDAAVLRAAVRLAGGSAADPADLTVAAAAADSGARPPLRAAAAVVCAVAVEAGQQAPDDLLRAAESAPALVAALPEEQPRRRAELAAVLAAARAGALLRTDAADDVLLDALRAALPAARAAGADRLAGRCQARLALLEALRGRLRTAAQLVADAEARADACGLPEDERSAAAATAAAWIAAERGEHPQLRLWTTRAQRRAAPDAEFTGPLLAVLASRQLRTRSEVDAAEQALRPALDGAAQPRWLRTPVTIERVRICFARRHGLAGLRLLDGLDAAHAALLRATAAALGLPGAPPPPAQPGAELPPSVAVPLGVVHACLHAAGGDTPAAVSAAERALRLAEPERLRGPFLDAPPALWPLLRGHPRLAAAAVWLNPAAPALPAPRRPPGAGHGPPSATVAAGPLVSPRLSEREREVLRHLAGMLSTVEIAAAMFVSVNTVRTHVRSILRKLAVTRRGEAVRRARELQLL